MAKLKSNQNKQIIIKVNIGDPALLAPVYPNMYTSYSCQHNTHNKYLSFTSINLYTVNLSSQPLHQLTENELPSNLKQLPPSTNSHTVKSTVHRERKRQDQLQVSNSAEIAAKMKYYDW